MVEVWGINNISKLKLMKNKIVLVVALALAVLGITRCKKTKEVREPDFVQNSIGTSILPDYSKAKLFNSYSGVTYNEQLGMLEFSSRESFNAVAANLNGEMDQYSKDNGNTAKLLEAINTI